MSKPTTRQLHGKLGMTPEEKRKSIQGDLDRYKAKLADLKCKSCQPGMYYASKIATLTRMLEAKQ